MVMGHNTKDARYILIGDSIEDLEKGLAEMKRQIAAGITFSVCYGGDDKCRDTCDNDDPNDNCIDSYGNYDSEHEVKEETDKDKAIVEMTEGIVAAFKDFLGM